MLTRRQFVTSAGAAFVSVRAAEKRQQSPLDEFSYGDVDLAPGLAEQQFRQTQSILLSLNDDSLLKPFRLRAGLPAAGPEMGGWYDELPLEKTESGGHGFAPAHSFGQWLSALARGYAVDHNPAAKAKLERLLDLYAQAISERFYTNFRFPAYVYDKMVIALIDARQFANVPNAFDLLNRTTDAAEPHLPPTALDRDEPQRQWRASIGENTSNDYTWDESYTLPENLFLAWERGAGERYQQLGRRFLLDRTYFDPLAEGRNVIAHHHAYSFCNALSSAMQAYLADGSQKHLRAAKNAFRMITDQSYATGGWGPNESFIEPGTDALYESLTNSHRSFETPCGSYAHLKLARYLLRVSLDASYGDSMERVVYNTVLGASPLQPDGRAFYYSDYNMHAAKSYFPDCWPCCSGTLPQVAADYRLLVYFRDNSGVYVNLYLPSTLRWVTGDGAQCRLIQSGDYPLDSRVRLAFRSSRPSRFAVRLRIPAWAAGTKILLNGQRISPPVVQGFATISRLWADGDAVDLSLPLRLRLQPIDAHHPETVALMRGPLVLFALASNPPRLTREQLHNAAKDKHEFRWRVTAAGEKIEFAPFTAISDQRYTTYLTIA